MPWTSMFSMPPSLLSRTISFSSTCRANACMTSAQEHVLTAHRTCDRKAVIDAHEASTGRSACVQQHAGQAQRA